MRDGILGCEGRIEEGSEGGRVKMLEVRVMWGLYRIRRGEVWVAGLKSRVMRKREGVCVKAMREGRECMRVKSKLCSLN